MRNAKKMTLAAFALIAAVALIACGSSDDGTTGTGGEKSAAEGAPAAGGKPMASADDVPTIVVQGGEPVGGVQKLEFEAGEEVRFRVSSDASEEIHLHGYDISKQVPAGGTVEFAFPAELEGIYEAELEALGVQIAELQINP